MTLPDEIVEAILCKLQVKTLLRFRCVSKSWNSLISSKRFITSHLHNSKKNPNLANCQTILGIFCKRSMIPVPFPFILPECPPIKQRSLEYPADDPILNVMSDCSVCFVGCCNGLICLRPSTNFDYYLWNPSIRTFKKLPCVNPNSTDYIVAEGLGFDELNGDYKVFCQYHNFSSFSVARIYSLKTDSWRTIECIGGEVQDRRLTFVNGKLYMAWYENCGLSRSLEIVSFDLDKEVYEKVPLPSLVSQTEKSTIWLQKVDECLCLLHERNGWDVWILRKRQHESWTKFVTIPYDHFDQWMIPSLVSLYRDTNGDQILLYHFQSSFLFYRLKDNTTWASPNWMRGWNMAYAYVYIESLVEPA